MVGNTGSLVFLLFIVFLFLYNFIYLFIFDCAGSCVTGFSLVVASGGYSLVAV